VIIFTAWYILSLGPHNCVFAGAEEEKLTICTYYPAPSGTYNQLTTTGNTYLATTSGNVGIGTTAPQGLLQVGTSPGAGLIVTPSGNVGIGTTAGNSRLYVNGNAYVNGNIDNVGGTNPQIGYNGVVNVIDRDYTPCQITIQDGIITSVASCPEVG
jgi:hypothetical protein